MPGPSILGFPAHALLRVPRLSRPSAHTLPACRYLVLCPAYSTEEGAASDYLTLRATTAADPRLGDIPDHQDLLTIFTTEEVTGASALLERYQKEIAAQVWRARAAAACAGQLKPCCLWKWRAGTDAPASAGR